MNYDDETLMAYTDGELDQAKRAEISAAVEKDPELARRVARHGALRSQVAGAFARVVDEPVPDRLREAARAPRGNVVNFPSRGTRAPGPRWRAREWTAMAASLVLGGLLSWQFAVRDGGDIGTAEGAVVARGELVKALNTQLASNQPVQGAVHIGLSFKSADGAYCRSFVSRASSTAGLACRSGEQWRVVITNSVASASGEIRQADSLPPAVLQAIEARRSGEALDAAGEQAARDAGWR